MSFSLNYSRLKPIKTNQEIIERSRNDSFEQVPHKKALSRVVRKIGLTLVGLRVKSYQAKERGGINKNIVYALSAISRLCCYNYRIACKSFNGAYFLVSPNVICNLSFFHFSHTHL